ncbi:serine protein kinase RIO [Candidatus Woesearchaeota archaeon]|nr:serine protein kinase RIO [Candidatus Woesearchaeota archaeon]
MRKDKFKTMKNVFDDHAEKILFKLMSEGHFEGLESPVLIGKEANIFTARKGEGKVIVKIYRLETSDFRKMYEYIRYDTRYLGLMKKKRLIIFSWCQREFRNLLKAREAGLNVPTPIAFKDNILVMEMIGKDSPAPQLKDKHPKNPEKFYNGLLDNLASLYSAGFVHGDVSEFNILNDNGTPVIIDFSQASPLRSANSKELLERDARNISRFFSKLGIDTEKEEVMNRIIG